MEKTVEGDEYLEFSDETLESFLVWAFLAESATFALTVRTAVRSYHMYKDIWAPAIGDEFDCRQVPGNEEDSYAVAVYGDSESSSVLGHLSREISRVSFFLEHDGTITGKVTGRRRYCRPRSGLEMSCELTFTGKRKHIQKLRSYFQSHHFACTDGLI